MKASFGGTWPALPALYIALAVLTGVSPILAQVLGGGSQDEAVIGWIIDKLANLYDQGRYIEAVASAERTLKEAEGELGLDHAVTLQSLDRPRNLAEEA